MIKKKTHEQFIEELINSNPNIKVLEMYVNDRVKLQCECLICKHIWGSAPTNLLRKKGCPKCAGNIKKTHEEFIKQLYNISPNIKVIGKYINNETKIKCKCLIDNYERYAKLRDLLQGISCPKCVGNIKKTHKQFIEELKNVNPNIRVISEYVNTHTKIKCQCLIDNYEWYAIPVNLLSGKGCCKCNNSKLEYKTSKILDNLRIKYIEQYTFEDCKYKKLLKFDFYLPDYNICIECQGQQHYIPIDFSGNKKQAEDNFNLNQIRDNIKCSYCISNNIKLIKIPYWDINNIEERIYSEVILNNNKKGDN